VEPKSNFRDIEGFQELWAHIAPRTTYRLSFDTDVLVAEACRRMLESEPISTPAFTIQRTGIEMGENIGVTGKEGAASERRMRIDYVFPDVLAEVTSEVPVSRATVLRVAQGSGKLREAHKNPAQFRRQLVEATRHALAHTLKENAGIQYTRRTGSNAAWDMEFFVTHHAEAYEDTLVNVSKSIYSKIPVDSEVERQFAIDLDKRDDVVLFVKLPSWYKVDTPVGGYNPDWAIVRKDGGGLSLYLVRETKGSSNLDDLFREHEVWKVTFGRKHFEAINVDYKVVKEAIELDKDNPEELR
jgi:type III restriction enzyme